jgi:YgiT-type zinc finger domain-containing protein
MTGKEEKNKVKQCPLCGGGMEDGITTLPFLIVEKVVVIRNVPAEIVGEVERLLDRLEELHSEVSIIYYKAA